MPTGLRKAALRAAAALLGAGLLAACTIDDRFLLPEPEPEVSLEVISGDPAPRETSCPAGTTVYWGRARNTGDVFLYDVVAVVDVFGGAGELLGRFSGSVFNGESGSDEFGNSNPDTTLDVDQAGDFVVCTSVPWGIAGRADVRFEYVIFESEE